jgi:hypothetical protein
LALTANVTRTKARLIKVRAGIKVRDEQTFALS